MISRSTDVRSALRSSQRGFLLNPARFGVGGSPNYANRVLGLHFDGANGSTTFTDNSPTPKTIVPVGNAQISTAQSVFGGASGLFDGTGDQLTIVASSAFAFGTGDYTVRFRIRPAIVNNFMHILQTGNYDADQLSIRTNASGQIQIFHDFGGTLAISTSMALTLNTWADVEVSRASGVTKGFINGVQGFSTSVSYSVASNGNVRIGSRDDTSSFQLNGYLDELEVYKGVALNTANFTPPTSAFANS